MSTLLKTWGALVVGLTLTGFTLRPPASLPRKSDFRPVLLRPVVASTVSRPFLPLLIDVYWLRVVNAIALPDSPEKSRSLYEYALVLTDLDPRFLTVYEYLGLNIPFQTDRNAWILGELAEDLFRRGLAQYPNEMKLHLYLGFTLFQMEHKYKEASKVFYEGSKLERAPPFMAPLAARLLSHDGSAREGLALLRQIIQDSTDEQVRADLEGRAQQLEIEVVLQDVDAAAARFRADRGVGPASFDELLSSGYYLGPREDPAGGTITLREDGRAFSTSLERRYELYQ